MSALIGERFARAIAEKDSSAIRELLADSCTLRPIVPNSPVIGDVRITCRFDPKRFSADHPHRRPQRRFVEWQMVVKIDIPGAPDKTVFASGWKPNTPLVVQSTNLPFTYDKAQPYENKLCEIDLQTHPL